MTPCEERGWKEGDLFEMRVSDGFESGSVVRLFEDDGSDIPLFTLVKGKLPPSSSGEDTPIYVCMGNVTKLEGEQSRQSSSEEYDFEESCAETSPQKSGITYKGRFYPCDCLDDMYALLDALHTIEEITQNGAK